MLFYIVRIFKYKFLKSTEIFFKTRRRSKKNNSNKKQKLNIR